MTKCPQVIWKFYMTWHWVSLIGSIRFESVQIGSSRFESALFNSSRFESVQIEPLRVGLTALIELNRTEWAKIQWGIAHSFILSFDDVSQCTQNNLLELSETLKSETLKIFFY